MPTPPAPPARVSTPPVAAGRAGLSVRTTAVVGGVRVEQEEITPSGRSYVEVATLQDGEAARVYVGSVTAVAPGEPARVENLGTESQADLHFYIPAGTPGTPGRSFLSGSGAPSNGLGGDNDSYVDLDTLTTYRKIGGAWALQRAVGAPTFQVGTVTTVAPGSPASAANSGTVHDAVLDLEIPQGAAGTVAIGTVTTGGPGSEAAVVNSGGGGAAVLDFVIPQGPVGETGTFGAAWAGPWDSATAYVAGKIVRYGGASWLALAGSTNVVPVEGATWTTVASAGVDGNGDMNLAVYDPNGDGKVVSAGTADTAAYATAAGEAPVLTDGTDAVTASAARGHLDSTANPHGVTAAQAGAYTTAEADGLLAAKADLVGGVVPANQLPAKADLVDGVVPASQLPAYVDDVLEYASLAGFPATGASGRLYVAADVNKTYRWNGSAYVVVGTDLALGETATTAYRGDRGKTAYDHALVTTGNPHNLDAADVGLGLLPNYAAATQAEAEAGTAGDRLMTPLRTAQAIAALAVPAVEADMTTNGYKVYKRLVHGSNAAYARPTGHPAHVFFEWEGSVEPTNWIDGDVRIDTTA